MENGKEHKKSEKIKVIDNIIINEEEKNVKVSVNAKIYPLPIVYSALYSFLDKAYCYIDGDPKNEIIVTLIPKNPKDSLESLGRELNNELINCAAFSVRSKFIKDVRDRAVKNVTEGYKNDERNSC